MIPAMNIVAWGRTVPWVEQRQIEQDLIISRALVALFGDPVLNDQLRFRGGTALNKLHFSKPVRFSEDIDLTRTKAGGLAMCSTASAKSSSHGWVVLNSCRARWHPNSTSACKPKTSRQGLPFG
jgi:hypothetical protein